MSTKTLLAIGTFCLAIMSLPTSAQVKRCEVSQISGASSPQGRTGTIQMLNDGLPCGFTMYGVPSMRQNAATGGVITTLPKHGTAEFMGAKLQYTPQSGYVGEDTFTAQAWAKGASQTQHLLKVRINVQVRAAL